MHAFGNRFRLNSLWLLAVVAMWPVGAHAHPYKSKAIQSIAGVYRGHVGGREIVLEVGAADPEDVDFALPDEADLPVLGRYFYRDHGAALPLRGRFLKDGRLHMFSYLKSWAFGQLWLIFHGSRAQGHLCNCSGPPFSAHVKMSRVSLMRVSRGFNPRLTPWLGPESGPYLDKEYYDLLVDYPPKRAREVRVNNEISYVMVSDPRFNISFPRLTRFPDAKIMAKINRKLTGALHRDQIKAADCLFKDEIPLSSCNWKGEESHVALISRDLLSVVREVSEIEDWFEVPSVTMAPLIYNLHTGGFFYWQDLLHVKARRKYDTGDSEGSVFSGTEEHKLLSRLYQAHASLLPTGCDDQFSNDSFKAYFNKQGLVLMDNLAEIKCSRDVIIPYSELRPLVRKGGPFRSLVEASGTTLMLAGSDWPELSARKFNNSGLGLYQRNFYDAAILQYSEAIRFSPNAQAFQNRGNAYRAKGDYDHAIEDYNQALRLEPGYFEVLLDRGLSYDNQGHYDQAIQDYTEAIRLDPNYAEAFFQRGSDYDLRGDKSNAARDLEQAVRLVGGDAQWVFGMGAEYHDKHDFMHAIRAYDQVIRMNPNDYGALTNRGNISSDQGDYDHAIADYTQAGQFFNRGLLYREKRDYERAIQDFTEIIRLYPHDAPGFEQRCDVYLLKGDYERAVGDCTQALHLESLICRACSSSDVYASRGLARLYAGDTERAYEDFSHSVSFFQSVWLYLAHVRADKQALKRLKEQSVAVDSWPYPVLRLFLGESTPEEVMNAAGNNQDRQCEADLYLGEYYNLHGNRAQAQSSFQSVTESCSETLLESRIARAELKRMELH